MFLYSKFSQFSMFFSTVVVCGVSECWVRPGFSYLFFNWYSSYDILQGDKIFVNICSSPVHEIEWCYIIYSQIKEFSSIKHRPQTRHSSPSDTDDVTPLTPSEDTQMATEGLSALIEEEMEPFDLDSLLDVALDNVVNNVSVLTMILNKRIQEHFQIKLLLCCWFICWYLLFSWPLTL